MRQCRATAHGSCMGGHKGRAFASSLACLLASSLIALLPVAALGRADAKGRKLTIVKVPCPPAIFRTYKEAGGLLVRLCLFFCFGSCGSNQHMC